MIDATNPPTCPSCFKVIDGASCVTSGEVMLPQRGDLSICAYCAEVLVFKDDNGYSRKVTEEDVEEWDEETFKTVTEAVLTIHKSMAANKLGIGPC